MELTDNPLYANSHKLWDWCVKHAKVKVGLDIGANEGGYTASMLEHGIEKVHAFEPVPDMAVKLQNRFRNDPRVFCNAVGVSDYPGRLEGITVLEAWTLGKPGDGGLSVCPTYKDAPPFSVDLVTIDDYMAGTPVGVIKLDVDGYEHKVLAGAHRTLNIWRPPILCEFSTYIAKVSGSAENFVRLITHLRYVTVTADGSRVFKTWEDISPHYPHNSSFNVMLLPAELATEILEKFKATE